MENKDLLIIARGMGLHAQTAKSFNVNETVREEIVTLFSDETFNGYIGRFNPTETELIKWLYDDIGVLQTNSKLDNKYVHQIDNEKPSYHLKENLLSIVLQGIRD